MVTRIARAALLSVLSLAFFVRGAGAAPAELIPGSQVRMTVAAHREVVRLAGVTGEGLLVDRAGAPESERVGWDVIESLEARHPRSRGEGARVGAKRGLVVGLGVVGIAVLGLYTDFAGLEDVSGLEAAYVTVGSIAFVGLATGTGALVGALSPGTEWRDVLDAGLREGGQVIPPAPCIEFSLRF